MRPETHAEPGGAPAAEIGGPRGSRRMRIFAGGVPLLLAAAALAFGGGFLWFADAVATHEVTLQDRADGIVVLTGGASRVDDAIELLAEGRGKRLLITGVHRATSTRDIARAVPHRDQLLACCVDLDHSAVNTTGNATETRRWVNSQGFHSLIVVTSNYHMPRSMAELGRQLPDTKLIPFPVVSDKAHAEPWWQSLGTTRLLLSEYLKYMVVQVRMRLEPAPEPTDVARMRNGVRS